MPDCILRVFGSKRRIDAFLTRAKSVKAYSVFQKGQPLTAASSRVARRTGFNVLVSRADGNLVAQVQDALRFLTRHRSDLSMLHELLGPGHAILDFGLWDISSENLPWPKFQLPPRLIAEAGRYGFGLESRSTGPPGGE